MGVPRQGLRDLVEPLLGEGVCPAAHRVTDILPELLHRGHRVLSLLYSVRRYASLSNSKFLNTKPEACHVVLQNGVACRGEERGKGKHHRRLWEGPRNPYFRLGASLASWAQRNRRRHPRSQDPKELRPRLPSLSFPSQAHSPCRIPNLRAALAQSCQTLPPQVVATIGQMFAPWVVGTIDGPRASHPAPCLALMGVARVGQWAHSPHRKWGLDPPWAKLGQTQLGPTPPPPKTTRRYCDNMGRSKRLLVSLPCRARSAGHLSVWISRNPSGRTLCPCPPKAPPSARIRPVEYAPVAIWFWNLDFISRQRMRPKPIPSTMRALLHPHLS